MIQVFLLPLLNKLFAIYTFKWRSEQLLYKYTIKSMVKYTLFVSCNCLSRYVIIFVLILTISFS
jgi:hypothetical protein